MGVLDGHVAAGKESTYGTPVATTRSFEAQVDPIKRLQTYLQSRGIRRGVQTTRTDRRRAVNMGGEGQFTVDALSKGMGLLLEHVFGSSAIAQQGATTAWLQTHTTTQEGPVDKSLTVQAFKPFPTTGGQAFTAHGGKVASWELSCEAPEGLLVATLNMDYEDVTTAESEGVPTYPASSKPFGWPDIAVTVNAVAVDPMRFTLSGNNALKTDRRLMRKNVLKKQPVRNAMPDYTGNLAAEFDSLTLYNHFVSGVPVPIVITITGDLIEAGHNYEIVITMPECQVGDDATPQMSLEDVGSQPVPFTILHGSSPAVSLTYKSVDTAF